MRASERLDARARELVEARDRAHPGTFVHAALDLSAAVNRLGAEMARVLERMVDRLPHGRSP